PGYRAVSVKIDEVSGVAYQVKPGDWVDVIVVMDIESGSRGRKKQTIAEVILQHIQVAAIGQVTSGPAGGGADAKVKPAKSATLIVPEDDVPKLHLAGTRGKITLAMRGADEQVTDKPLIAKSDEVFRFASSPDPEPPPTMPVAPTVPTLPVTQPAPALTPKEAPHGVTVYHALPQGTKSETVMFENTHSRTILSLSEGPGSRAASIFGAPNRGKQTQPWQPVAPTGSAPGGAPTTDPNQPGDRGSVRPMNREEAEAVREEALDAMNESSGSDEPADRNAYPKEDE
ncbi:MAG: Flp pilus assembly protein CpaB, partial [Planctomycetes bacterium]|nr:Flp pilus assembly protein CpaB [Planctomycetota bacterium]